MSVTIIVPRAPGATKSKGTVNLVMSDSLPDSSKALTPIIKLVSMLGKSGIPSGKTTSVTLPNV